MGKGNYEYFIDRGYLDTQIAKLKAGLIAHIDQRLDELQGQLQPPKPVVGKKAMLVTEKAEPDPCMIWKMNMNGRCTELAKKYPKQNDSMNTVLRKIYLKMDGQYGVCLAQEVRDCKGGSDKKPSTLEAISQSEKLRNLFESILCNMEDECRLREEKAQAVAAAMLSRTRQNIIQPLIEARGDKSSYGCTTYMVVGKRMQKNKADFEAAEKRYREATGIKRTVKKNELIEWDAELKKKFAEAVTELLYEVEKADHERTS